MKNIVAWMLAGGFLGCAVPPSHRSRPAPFASPRARLESATVMRYLPLQDRSVLAYDTTDEETGERGLIVLQVARPRPGVVTLFDGGKTTRLEVVPDGVRYQLGGYWLREALLVGNCWQGKVGRVCVRRVGQTVRVPAGEFTDCLETVEQTPYGSQVTSVFCSGVGMTTLEVENSAGEDYQRIKAELRSYGPRVDLGATEER